MSQCSWHAWQVVHFITCMALRNGGVIDRWEPLEQDPLGSEPGRKRKATQQLQRAEGSEVQQGAAGASGRLEAGGQGAGAGVTEGSNDVAPAGGRAGAMQEELAAALTMDWITGRAGRGALGIVFKAL